jgi:uncharacterized membrane protein
VNDQILFRLEQLELRLADVEDALEEIRSPAGAARVPKPKPTPAPVTTAPARSPRPAAMHPPARVVRATKKPERPPREIDWSEVFGPKALAVVGGVVTVLGIVFFFALAVNRGWIGPEARIALGSAASLLVFGAGLELRRRYGPLHAPIAAVGAGIAGGYATLLAATALYDFVPEWGALMIAAGIAGIGLGVSLAWRSEIVAGIGLVGAMIAPALLIFDTGPTTVGTAFVALVLAAAAIVAVALRWRYLLLTAAVVGGLQAMVLFADRARPDAALLVLSASFCAIYLAAGIAWQLRGRADRVDGMAAAFLLGSAAFVFYSAYALFFSSSDLDRGIDLLAFAVAYAIVGAAFSARRATRDLGAVLVVLALALGAVGFADALSGESLTYVWAAEAVALAWLARRVREPRYQLAALAYLALALIHTFAIDSPLSRLFDVSDDPAAGIWSVVAVALASAAVAVATTDWSDAGPWAGVFARVAFVFDALRRSQPVLRLAAASLAAVLFIEAISLALLEAYSRWWPGSADSRFDHGQVAVTGLWAAVAVIAVAVGLRRRGPALAVAALVWLAVVLAKTLFFDASELGADLRSYSFLEVAGAVLIATVLVQALRARLWPDPTVAYFAILVTLGLTLSAVTTLLDGRIWRIDLQGAGLLGVAALYGLVAAGFLPHPEHRNFSTTFWVLGVAVLAAAEAQLFGGQWLVVAWAATGVALAALTRLTSERRLQVAAATYLGLAFALSFFTQATLFDLFSAGEHPGAGVPGLVAVILATFATARLCSAPRQPAQDRFDEMLDGRQAQLRSRGTWIAAGLALYALSLTILEIAEWIGPRDVTTDFQSGHTAVSAVWGGLGLALLYVGLRRGSAALRFGGLALFGVSLAKLFIYDLSRLSSITRALSFLAVGAVLLLGGFFYQRLAPRLEDREKVA